MKPAPNLDDIDLDLLPSRIADLVDVIGLKAALVIVELRGGIRLTVPKKAAPEHWLAEHIGLDALAKLSKVYGGETIEIDRCAAAIRAVYEARIVREHDSGSSNSDLARRYGYTERGIRKLRRRVQGRVPSLNYDLFDEV
jgi:Mor family transcriptional regulator